MLAYWLFCIFSKLEFHCYHKPRKTILETHITFFLYKKVVTLYPELAQIKIDL